MQNKISWTLFIFICIVYIQKPIQATDKHLLRYNFKPGTALYYDHELSARISVNHYQSIDDKSFLYTIEAMIGEPIQHIEILARWKSYVKVIEVDPETKKALISTKFFKLDYLVWYFNHQEYNIPYISNKLFNSFESQYACFTDEEYRNFQQSAPRFPPIYKIKPIEINYYHSSATHGQNTELEETLLDMVLIDLDGKICFEKKRIEEMTLLIGQYAHDKIIEKAQEKAITNIWIDQRGVVTLPTTTRNNITEQLIPNNDIITFLNQYTSFFLLPEEPVAMYSGWQKTIYIDLPEKNPEEDQNDSNNNEYNSSAENTVQFNLVSNRNLDKISLTTFDIYESSRGNLQLELLLNKIKLELNAKLSNSSRFSFHRGDGMLQEMNYWGQIETNGFFYPIETKENFTIGEFYIKLDIDYKQKVGYPNH